MNAETVRAIYAHLHFLSNNCQGSLNELPGTTKFRDYGTNSSE